VYGACQETFVMHNAHNKPARSFAKPHMCQPTSYKAFVYLQAILFPFKANKQGTCFLNTFSTALYKHPQTKSGTLSCSFKIIKLELLN